MKDDPISNLNEIAIRGLSGRNVWDFENAFYWFSHPTRLNKMLAQYELYKKIIDLPGDVVELGVYKAASLIRWATFRNVLENDFSRRIVGFDAFGKFPRDKLTSREDGKFIDNFEVSAGEGLTEQEVNSILSRKGFNNIQLVRGNVFDTLENFLRDNAATRISLLHMDMDVREPTNFALSLLYERVVPGGLIVFDDYNAVAGETEAVDEFLSKHKLRIEKISHYCVPSYIRKPL